MAILGAVLIGVIVVLVIAIGSLLNGAQPGTGGDPVGGSTSGPDAGGCDGCVTDADAATLVPGAAALQQLGLQPAADYQPAKPSIAGLYAEDTKRVFQDGLGTPEQCWALIDYSPVSATNPVLTDTGTGWSDRVFDLGSYGDDLVSVSQVVRVFKDRADAAGYPASLQDTIAACPRYAVSFDESRWDTEVTPTALDLSGINAGDVTAVGWDELDGAWAITVIDLQVNNLALRTVYSREAGTGPSDEQLVAFLADRAAEMRALG